MRGAAAAPASSQLNIVYHGGTILPNATTYAIWWGKPSDFPSDAREKLDEFLEGLDGSPYLAIADQYMLGEKAHTHFGGNFFDDSTPPELDPVPIILSGNDIIVTEIAKVLSTRGMKPDPTAVYMVYTANFPHENYYCAFHNANFAPDGITGVNYAYLPNMTNIPGCRFFEDPFIARNPISQGTRDVASATAHEFMESITDVYFDAWYDSNFSEVGDSCEYLALSGVPLEGSKWELQPIWSNQVSGCAQGGSHDVRILGALSNFGGIATFDIPDAAYGTFAESINQDGTSVGSYEDANFAKHGFARNKYGAIITLDGAANSINDQGLIAGDGFIRDKNGNITSINGTASSINDEGVAAGYIEDANFMRHGFVRDRFGAITTFDAPGATVETLALSINNSGVIAGFYTNANGSHGFVRDEDGAITPFNAPGAKWGTVAFSINDEGVVAGYFTDAKFVQHAFLRDEPGKFTTFDAPGAAYSTIARAINAQGLVAGYFSDEHGNARGFLRDKHGNFLTLGALVTSINARGGIAGYYSAPLR